MNYSIWSDFSFYVYVVLLIASAVVIVSSIRRLLNEENEELSINFSELEPTQSNQLQNNDIIEKRGVEESNIKPEEIIFKKEETIFDTQQRKEIDTHSDEKAVLFLKNLNENLAEIKNSLSKISSFEERLNDIELITKLLESEIKLLRKEQLNQRVVDQSFKDIGDSREKTTPKYVRKYLEDIIDDFDSLEKEIILKRIKAIVEDLKSISGE